MENEEFENLIREAVEALPEGIRTKLNNVEIVMEEGESPNNSLFGLYHGVSQLKRGSGYGLGATLPDKITIYKGTIEKFAQSPQMIPVLVRRVVWHEIGHHFGFDEAGIRRLEEKWEREGKV
ncbi:MAG: metallopeptidase family protein [Candidatus Doudnabacteria bacterium]|nr:metallopeptidase family protein [Candidatus Doudnabacteria bacterium]